MPLPVGVGGTGNVVQPLIGGGVIPIRALTMQLRDSGAYTLVAANSVTANTRVLLELSELYSAQTPTVTTFAGDTFRNSTGGAETVLNFIGAAWVELVSDGISEWAVNERAVNGAPATNLVTSVAGRTGAVVLTSADVGLGNVDNTSDVDKPVSTAVQAALIPSTVIPHTVSGTLTAGGAINQLRDSGTFTLPLANSVPANTYLVVALPERYTASTPVINRSGADTITNSVGTDTSITFAGSAKLTLTSDGVSDWSL